MKNLKFINAKQAKNAYEYKNTKRKLYRTIAAIWFNKTCREKEIKPNYIHIKINGNNKQCQNTMKAAIRTRVNQEIKFLYIKKQQLNVQLYKLHLNCANYWNNTWSYIQDSIERKLQVENEELYKKLNNKIDNLMKGNGTGTKRNHTHQQHNFYKRTANLTDIIFTKEELETLDLGLQHSTKKNTQEILAQPYHRDRKRHKTPRSKTTKRIPKTGNKKTKTDIQLGQDRGNNTQTTEPYT